MKKTPVIYTSLHAFSIFARSIVAQTYMRYRIIKQGTA
nr:MAG TPA: hypothetical protein [Caudoviricetes sp.]